jgi:NitT/TauT family transport system permease protein
MKALTRRLNRLNRLGPLGPRLLTPLLSLLAMLLLWEAAVWAWALPAYLLPSPTRVAQALAADWPSLLGSAGFTLKITLGALALAALSGAGLASLFALSRPLERALMPLALLLQVTPLVAVAPFILIYLESTTAALLLCAWIVAFFPVLSNTLAGFRALDPGLLALFRLYRASRWQTLRWLLWPSALPYLLAGLRVAAGLSLIGAVSAEMVAGAAGHETGLASRILEASFRTETPKMFAALALLVMLGLTLHASCNLLSAWVLQRLHLAPEPQRPD